jgi:small conductance mechanosensitive channel
MDLDSITNFIDEFNKGPWDAPFKIILIILISLAASSIAGRAIRRLVKHAVSNAHHVGHSQLRNLEDTQELSSTLLENRTSQRAYALGSLARSATIIFIWSVAVMMILSELGLNVGPLLASAGVLGVVLGFGAQTLVADYLAGVSMTLEDQLGVGDVVDCGVVLGTVEEVALRYTRIRDFYGVVWYVRNGTIAYIANQSQGWTYAVVDIALPYDADLTVVAHVINTAGEQMAADTSLDKVLLDTPVYAGLEEARGDAVVVRVMAKAVPEQQFVAARLIRERVKISLDRQGIHIPLNHITITEQQPPSAPNS